MSVIGFGWLVCVSGVGWFVRVSGRVCSCVWERETERVTRTLVHSAVVHAYSLLQVRIVTASTREDEREREREKESERERERKRDSQRDRERKRET
jgi:hypothetical protein